MQPYFMYCLSLNNEDYNKIKSLNYIPVGVGDKNFELSWLRDNTGENISEKNKRDHFDDTASLIVSRLGSGRVVIFADNPNFRGSWFGTNKLFLNAIFFGNNISVPTNN